MSISFLTYEALAEISRQSSSEEVSDMDSDIYKQVARAEAKATSAHQHASTAIAATVQNAGRIKTLECFRTDVVEKKLVEHAAFGRRLTILETQAQERKESEQKTGRRYSNQIKTFDTRLVTLQRWIIGVLIGIVICLAGIIGKLLAS